MKRTWLDNAFWSTEQHNRATAILQLEQEDGKVVTQVVEVRQYNPDKTENQDWIELMEQVGKEKIEQNTVERLNRKQREADLEQQRRQEHIRAAALEQLFEAKLKAFEIEDVKNSKNRIVKSKIRKAKNIAEVNAYTTIIIMEQLNAEQQEAEQPTATE